MFDTNDISVNNIGSVILTMIKTFSSQERRFRTIELTNPSVTVVWVLCLLFLTSIFILLFMTRDVRLQDKVVVFLYKRRLANPSVFVFVCCRVNDT